MWTRIILVSVRGGAADKSRDVLGSHCNSRGVGGLLERNIAAACVRSNNWTTEEINVNVDFTHKQTHTRPHARTHARTNARTFVMPSRGLCRQNVYARMLDFDPTQRKHARTHPHTHTHTHACMHACTHARKHAPTLTHSFTRSRARTHARACTHARTYVRTYVRTHARTHACMHAYIHTYIYTLYIHFHFIITLE